MQSKSHPAPQTAPTIDDLRHDLSVPLLERRLNALLAQDFTDPLGHPLGHPLGLCDDLDAIVAYAREQAELAQRFYNQVEQLSGDLQRTDRESEARGW